ncbi:hypothetical protein HMPREF1986_01010 [Oribacterium sp. oral taxon 078 str. F0263]|nr:hypothetical protein HMPREF1986_01010 [Oribacterium sp. oral taxon 078 str. F0263]
MVYCRNQFIGHFRKQDFRIRQQLRSFPFQYIPQFRNVAVT